MSPPRLSLLALSGIVAGCSGGSGGSGSPESSFEEQEMSACNDAGASYLPRTDAGTYSQVVGPAGGTVTADDGTTVVIPPGALSKNATIDITYNPYAPTLAQAQPLAVAHLFSPEGQHFLKPISVTLAFDPCSLPPGATVQGVSVWTAPSASNVYQALPTKVTDATHLTATTTDFCNMIPGVRVSGTVTLVVDGG